MESFYLKFFFLWGLVWLQDTDERFFMFLEFLGLAVFDELFCLLLYLPIPKNFFLEQCDF